MSKHTKPTDLDPVYVALVQRLADLIQQWCSGRPGLPDLRWHDPGGIAYIGALKGVAMQEITEAGAVDLVQMIKGLRHLADAIERKVQAAQSKGRV